MKKMNKFLVSSALLLGIALAGCSDPHNPHDKDISENDLKVTNVAFDVTERTLEVGGLSFEITATVSFVDDTPVDVDYLWNNSAPSIVSMKVNEADKNKCTVTPLDRGGKAYISLLVGLKTAACTVTVNSPYTPGPEPEPGPGPEPEPGEFSLSLDVTGKALVIGETLQLNATGNVPEEGSEWSGEVSWSSSDEDVASVVGGFVRALDEGDSTITATTTYEEKEYTATCLVSVQTEDEDLTCTVYFFIDYNNVDEEDTTGTKLLAKFRWYGDRPLSESLQVPTNPTTPMDPAFPYFVGWSDHAIVDEPDKYLWNMDKDVIGNDPYFYLYGIWMAEPLH